MGARRVLIGLTGINAMLVAVLLVQLNRASAASDADTIRARAIELVDQHGQIRAQLNVE